MRSQEEMPEPPWQMVGGVTQKLSVVGLLEKISYARPETQRWRLYEKNQWTFCQPSNKDGAGEKGPAALQAPA